jgi:thiol-disulfide isomerase/thioredoxin
VTAVTTRHGPFRRRWIAAVATIGLLAAGWAVSRQAALGDRQESDSPGRFAAMRLSAPDFPAGLEWLNTDRPLSLKDLRGKVVLLDFWTYCCINCHHVMPDLKKLEAKYPNELVVIGVHSAKFTTEQGTANIRQAILRHGLQHPVINDKDFQVWNRYAVKAWPTLVLIDPAGRIVTEESGEAIFAKFDRAIAETIADFDKLGKLERKPLQLRSEASTAMQRPLAFPGKIIADPAGKRLFVSDTNHHRIIVLTLPDHRVDTVIGSGEESDRDGGFKAAGFRQPQGMALQGDTLYVADTENHRIRAVDLKAQTVTTVAGTGKQAFQLTGGKAMTTPLNSPWDLTAVGDTLYIAMAGNHQIWAMSLNDGLIRPYAGSGREALQDGMLHEAAFAQPSGITTDGKHLFIADAETSAVRQVDLPPGNQVTTLVGHGLFDFGDQDGTGGDVRLQHPLGVAWHDGRVYLTDTYNNKIKAIDPLTRKTTTIAGTGAAGHDDGKAAKFDEPGGLAFVGKDLYIADTNNHLIRLLDLATGQVNSPTLQGLDRMAMRIEPTPSAGRLLPVQRTAVGKRALKLRLALPKGYHLNPEAPSFVMATASGSLHTAGDKPFTMTRPGDAVTIPLTVASGPGQVTIDVSLYYCEAGKEALCRVHNERVTLPVTPLVAARAPGIGGLQVTITVPNP